MAMLYSIARLYREPNDREKIAYEIMRLRNNEMANEREFWKCP
jgi:hypothetical protein